MQTWTARRPSPIAERFWSLAETANRGATGPKDKPVGAVRHMLDILSALQGSRSDTSMTRGFLAELLAREVAGDFSYSAPERYEGRDSGERALVYSVAVLLFEGLTGRHPFAAADGARRLSQPTAEELGRIVAAAREVPPALRGLLTRAMRSDPEERFASVAALRVELEWFVVAEEEEGAFVLPPERDSARAPVYTQVPAVVVEPEMTSLSIALPPRRAAELELETAVVPRMTLEELTAPPPPRSIKLVSLKLQLPRISEPRRRARSAVVLLALTLGLGLASAGLTALVLLLAQRR